MLVQVRNNEYKYNKGTKNVPNNAAENICKKYTLN